MGLFLQSYSKDPDSTELYRVDFAPLMLENEYSQIDVTGFEIIIETGVSVVHSFLEGSIVGAYIGGGSSGSSYLITFRSKLKNPSGAGSDVSLDRSIKLSIAQL